MSEPDNYTKRPVAVVVERDPFTKELFEEFLAEAGYKVEFANDGYIALDIIRLNPPQLLITEMMVPRLDGLALTRILKSEKETKTLPIVLSSVLDAAQRATSAGADAFLKKPFEKNRVLAVLKTVERRHEQEQI